ncbi:phage integrase Arm DNA-binding domain-containing protein [Pluralibacter gergoviae]|uniref:Phage integrase Arm DNA-binding domain-containing protein n=1 Tax=Pluralibacter gergoviae TaxID=61647 RepID=A0AAI9DNA7_PLUGE|nr:phage integrase Arm DNA-binding domain-containing protein [Pluralibacter gergoviae]EKV9910107.1 phage integrase Arm DNA-binding domain-containing protein [Pluralibacter gergoviae]EKW7275012.1 phage integrase Arm DNA-binding domain-containing protein [Pluralibacter gergoviae]ELD4297412.1 phage integrase Arm DNA-binding domain-containing protein [Pluralibacter gergoviae]ELD4308159.1 phage integrase Arm DNA-binding domain-containing protein [Pluralibacter gergoviae]
MAARPRTHKITIPNLYSKLDKRTGRVYWQYKHPITGKFHSLGTDADEAKKVACEANDIIAEQRTRQILSVNEKIARMRESREFITVTTWLDRYLDIQQERLESDDIKINSVKQKKKPVELLRQHSGMMYLKDITTLEIAEIVDDVKSQGYNRMAQVVRTTLIDVFKEAQHAGHVPPGYNPAQATKKPKGKITRQRLNTEEWKKIFEIADSNHRYMGNAMLLALVTGQRLGDISNMKFSDIWDDHLHIIQEKTGSKIAIPLSIRLNAIDWSLRDIVGRCRDNAVSPYLVHFFHSTSQADRGSQVKANTMTMNFKKARDKADIDWGEGTPASFHEQRSLSGRLYKAQGIDTQQLLGHRSPNQTAKYHDDRGKDWSTVAI